MSIFILEAYAGPALAVVATVIVLAISQKKWISRHPPYPPGPKGLPIIGNLFDFPASPIWEGLARMAQEYVVLSNPDVTIDLLERRSAVYSDRPRLPMLKELIGCSWTFATMEYGTTWRVHRRLFHRFFNVQVAGQFDDKVHKAINAFLHRLSECPERFLKHAHFLTGSLVLSVVYGVNVESEGDKFYSASEDAMGAIETAIMPGAFLVDILPILKYVPEWFPGAGFKTFARVAKENIDHSANLPFQHVKESFEADTLTAPSIVATCLGELAELRKGGVDEEAIRGMGGTTYLAGEETTSSAIKSFFLAATLHPEVVRSAQQELDNVVGRERLADFSDMPQLPYISAIVKEVLRWRPPTPAGNGHRLMEDNVYRGLLIPAGTTILDNTWAAFRNESMYPDAHTFNPDRFLKDGQINPEVKDPEQFVFGWGRRICPGRHFASRVLFLTIARTLAVFDISKCLDGNPVIQDEKYTFGGISSDIKPRSTQALSLIAGQ